MFFKKQKPEDSFSQKNLRRRFHHFLISKRKNKTPRTPLPKYRPKRMLRQTNPVFVSIIIKIIAILVVIAVLASAFYTVFFSPFFVVQKISLEKKGNAVAATSLAPFFDKLKGKNILFIKTSALIREIEQTFKNEVLLTRITKSYPDKIIVKIEEYPAVFNLRISNAENQLFVINQLGYAILENIEQKDIPILFLRTDKQFRKNTVIIGKEFLLPIVDSYKKFTDIFGMKIVEMEWKKTERELHMKTEKNFYVWLDLTQPVEIQINKLKRSLPKLDIYNQPLEYIDLRISGGENEKVIFKKK